MKIIIGLTVALLVCGRASAAQTNDPAAALGWELAIHARTFKNFSFDEAMDKTAALGVKYMSFSGSIDIDSKSTPIIDLSDAQLDKIRQHAAAKGIQFVNAYVNLPPNEARCRKAFEFARKMGLHILVGEPPPAALDIVAKLCQEYNVQVAIHDHPQPSHYWNPETVLAAIHGHEPWLGACADTGHWMRSGLDPVECLKKLQGHILCLHFKDLNERTRAGHDVPWGTGAGNVRGMMEELKRQGFRGAFCVEYEYHWDTSTPEIAQCKKFFDETCADLAATPVAP